MRIDVSGADADVLPCVNDAPTRMRVDSLAFLSPLPSSSALSTPRIVLVLPVPG